jgi:hypothetical protein
LHLTVSAGTSWGSAVELRPLETTYLRIVC